MFSDALSASLLQLCDEEKLSYEAAAERVGFSTKYFGRIVRRESSPTIRYFERLCRGFGRTPNEMLRIPVVKEENLYHVPMSVNEMRVIPAAQAAFPVCPKCRCSLEREYQAYCDRCGQCLLWNEYHKANAIIIPPPQQGKGSERFGG